MKLNSTAFFLLLPGILWGAAGCEKEEPAVDPRDHFTGTYHVRGTSRFVFDAFGRYGESSRNDSATFSIEKVTAKDSLDYVRIKGAAIEGPEYSIRFVTEGVPVVARMEGNTLTIPVQFPWSGAGLWIDGEGTVDKNALQIRYRSFYRGLSRYTDLTGNRL
jgi:hypothetical protein